MVIWWCRKYLFLQIVRFHWKRFLKNVDFGKLHNFSHFKSIGSWYASDIDKNIQACNTNALPGVTNKQILCMHIYVNKPCCDALSKREVYHPQQLISFGYHICLLYLVIYPYSNQFREGTTVLLTHTQIFLCVDTFSDTKLCCLMQGFTRVE